MVEEEREEEDVQAIMACKSAGGFGEKRASSNFGFRATESHPVANSSERSFTQSRD